MAKIIFSVSDEEVAKTQDDPVSDWKNVEEWKTVEEFFSNNLEHRQAPSDFENWWSDEHSRFTAEDLEDY